MGGDDDPLILTNAWVVTRDRAFLGTVELVQEHIVAVYRGATALAGAIDLHGDYLLPGLVELRTCNLCRHLSPRPGFRLPTLSAVLAHDAEIISAGITTAFDHLVCGLGHVCAIDTHEVEAVIRLADTSGLMRSDHRLSLDTMVGGPLAVEAPRRALSASMSDQTRPANACTRSADAARRTIMVAATALMEANEWLASSGSVAAGNLVDVLFSEDHPPSLLQGAFRLYRSPLRMSLAEAIATVSATPAKVAGLSDRGEIAPGKRADLVRVCCIEGVPIVHEVWRAGRRVY